MYWVDVEWDGLPLSDGTTYKWINWARNGESVGTTGLSKCLEAIETILVKKGTTFSEYGKQAAC